MDAKRRLDLALDASGIGVYHIDLRTGTICADGRYLAMLGYSLREIHPTLDWWRGALHPHEVDEVNASLGELITGNGERFRSEYRMRHRDGRWIWVEDRARIAERDKHGQPLLIIGVHIDISQRKRAEQKLAYQAEHDQLTHLLNRHSFLYSLKRVHAESQRTQRPYCIAMLDLDLFKQVNDTYGHLVGDRVLSNFAKLLRRSLREADWAARWGGEEFIVLMPNTEADQAQRSMERLRKTLATARFGMVEPPIRVTVSAGIAESNMDDRAGDEVIKRADTALYAAKHLGRDRVCPASVCQMG
ncbi:GGDEF domain-containing protein [Halochromatium roseum]|uniref:GGDEF domain-containing protein n=1 Tax=Halochromatium roseum TaxID=391920 RepID=UPI00191248A9|nr:sensor domain-containing diguanylate cyclase [Halochromatium roseum]MBK5940704.1 hypothetical protein [Halochromatium roseum]